MSERAQLQNNLSLLSCDSSVSFGVHKICGDMCSICSDKIVGEIIFLQNSKYNSLSNSKQIYNERWNGDAIYNWYKSKLWWWWIKWCGLKNIQISIGWKNTYAIRYSMTDKFSFWYYLRIDDEIWRTQNLLSNFWTWPDNHRFLFTSILNKTKHTSVEHLFLITYHKYSNTQPFKTFNNHIFLILPKTLLFRHQFVNKNLSVIEYPKCKMKIFFSWWYIANVVMCIEDVKKG